MKILLYPRNAGDSYGWSVMLLMLVPHSLKVLERLKDDKVNEA